MSAALLAVVLVVAQPSALVLEVAAERLVRELALDRVAEFDRSDRIAVTAPPDGRGLADLVLGQLRRRGVRRLMRVGDASVARDRGADWLLVLTRTSDALRAELRQVDAGLWSPIDPGVFASATVGVSTTPAGGPRPGSSVGEPPRANPAAGLVGPPTVVAEPSEEVLALAACPGRPESAIVLTRRRLYRATLSESWTRGAELDLSGLAPHAQRSRFPVGAVLCTPTEVVFASSELADGHAVGADDLHPRRTLDGAPLALGPDGLRLGRLAGGRPRWQVGEAVVRAFAGGRSDVVLTVQDDLLNDDTTLAKSGLGATAREIEGRLYWVRTGLGAWGDDDEIQLGVGDRLVGEPLPLPGSVRATALGRFTGDAWTLLVAWVRDGGSTLALLRVVQP